MDPDTRKWYEARAIIVKALAHPTRLYLVHELLEGERCVRELTKLVGADMSTVSKHLSILKNVGIIEDDKRGSQVYYKLTVTCIENFYTCIETIMRITADRHMAGIS